MADVTLTGKVANSHLTSDFFHQSQAVFSTPFSMLVNAWFGQKKKAEKSECGGGEELWNSIEGQNGNHFAWSSFLLYFDIWCPLPGQIGAIQIVCRRREKPSVSLSPFPTTPLTNLRTQELALCTTQHSNRLATLVSQACNATNAISDHVKNGHPAEPPSHK